MSHQSAPGPSRRQVLATGAIASVAVIGAAGIGSVVAALTDLPARHRAGAALASIGPSSRATVPAALVAALAREQQLLAAATAARTAQPADPILAALAALVADHQAHAAAIQAAISALSPSRALAVTPGARPATAPTTAQLKAGEQAAHDAAAAESATLRGAAAVLLASIAACEAGHVELFE